MDTVSVMVTMKEADGRDLGDLLESHPDALLRLVCARDHFGAFVEVKHLGTLPDPLPNDVTRR